VEEAIEGGFTKQRMQELGLDLRNGATDQDVRRAVTLGLREGLGRDQIGEAARRLHGVASRRVR
jgi:hypothetical protein